MFDSIFQKGFTTGAKLVGLSTAIANAIAYAPELQTSAITVKQVGTLLFVSGTAASMEAMEAAMSIVTSLADSTVLNDLSPAY
jgi:hypothetical protein